MATTAMASSSSAGPSASTSTATDLLPSLRSHNSSFLSLLSLIPPQFYLAPDDDEDDDEGLDAGQTHKFMKNTRKIKRDEASDARKERKRAKLDPENVAKTVLDVQEERRRRDEEQAELDEGSDDDDEDDEDGDDDEEAAPAPAAPQRPVATATSLRQKLAQRIASLQARRGGGATGANMSSLGVRGGDNNGEDNDDSMQMGDDSLDGDSSVGDGSMASTRDELLEERRRKRGEMRDRRRRERKEQRRAEAAAQAAQADSKGKDGNNKAGPSSSSAAGSKAVNGRSVAPTLLVPEGSNSKKLRNGDDAPTLSSDVTFSNLQFAGSDPSAKKRRDKNALPSDPKQALQILQARKAKAAESGEANADAADDARWSQALSASKGVKIRNDEALLKKSVARKEKAKQKSSSAWAERKEDLTKKIADKDRKRSENLQARRDAKKNKKMGIKPKASKSGGAKGGDKGGKKGKSSTSSGKGAKAMAVGSSKGGRAGFEGKKFGGGGGGKKGGGGGGKRK